MQLALRNSEVNDEFIEKIEGQKGLLFTSHDRDTVVEWFEEYSAAEFARSGFVATETFALPEGPLPDFSHAIEPHLRKLGMPTKLERGKIKSPYFISV
jgi:mRNA turnover protein 4